MHSVCFNWFIKLYKANMAEDRPKWYIRTTPALRITRSPFAFRNALLDNCGEPKSVSRARNGSYTIEAWNKEQSQQISKIQWIWDTPVHVEPHSNFNGSRCVIFCPDLVDCNYKIVKNLDSIGVSSAWPLGKSDAFWIFPPNLPWQN